MDLLPGLSLLGIFGLAFALRPKFLALSLKLFVLGFGLGLVARGLDLGLGLATQGLCLALSLYPCTLWPCFNVTGHALLSVAILAAVG